MSSVPAAAEAVARHAEHGGVLVDFDGVLSAIVPDPTEARPLAGAAEALEALTDRYEVVGVVSGRPIAFLEQVLPTERLLVVGLYGLEMLRGGRRKDHPYAGAWREAVDDVAQCSASLGPEGMTVEAKGLSLTLHYRTRPELEDEVRSWAAGQAARSGLVVRDAKMSVELHPPIDSDKGTTVAGLADGLEAVCYVGDDRGDVPAFEALDALAAKGVHTLKVAVSSDEAPPDLLEAADLVVEGPEGALELLRQL